MEPQTPAYIDPYGPYVQSDLNHIHNPAIYNIRRIKKQGLVVCQCCITEIDSNDLTADGMIFRYETETVINDFSRIKTIYCANCLNHIGIKVCPTIRGVSAYKSVDPTIVSRLKQL